MATNNLKKSVLKANEKEALKLWSTFQALNNKEDWKANGVEFRKKDILTDTDGAHLKTGSFEIRYTKVIDGVRKGKAIFRFLKREIGNEIQWNEKFVTIPE